MEVPSPAVRFSFGFIFLVAFAHVATKDKHCNVQKCRVVDSHLLEYHSGARCFSSCVGLNEYIISHIAAYSNGSGMVSPANCSVLGRKHSHTTPNSIRGPSPLDGVAGGGVAGAMWAKTTSSLCIVGCNVIIS